MDSERDRTIDGTNSPSFGASAAEQRSFHRRVSSAWEANQGIFTEMNDNGEMNVGFWEETTADRPNTPQEVPVTRARGQAVAPRTGSPSQRNTIDSGTSLAPRFNQWASSSAPASPKQETGSWPMPQRITDPNTRRSLGIMSASRDVGTGAVRLTNKDGEQQKIQARASYTAPRPPSGNFDKPGPYQVTLQTTGRQTAWQSSSGTNPNQAPSADLTRSQPLPQLTSSGTESPLVPSRPARPTPTVPPTVPPPRPASQPRNKRVAIKEGYMNFNQKTSRYARLTLYNLCVWRSQDSMNEGDPPVGQVSLGFKRVEVIGPQLVSVTSTLPLSPFSIPAPLLISFNTPADCEGWCEALNTVAGQYLEMLVKQKKLIAANPWVELSLNVWIGSWNVGNAMPDDMHPWLPNDNANHDYDIIVVGSQECRYSTKGVSNEDDWFGRVMHTIGPNYTCVAKHSLWEIRNIVLVKHDLVGFIHSVDVQTVATGIANTLGNKGGVAISFGLFDTSLCFITAHLAAHLEKVDDRNEDYHMILSGLHMGTGHPDVNIINHFDYLFFYGDLNYRLESPRDVVLHWISNKELAKLRGVDQLFRERNNGNVFFGFHETPPDFRPTYRYTRNQYDSQGERIYSEEKMRVPSWCDRVLWKNRPGTTLSQSAYINVDSVASSDHSPVYAAFKLGMRLPLSIINIPGELPRARSSREGGLLLFSKVSAKINLTRSGIASPSSPGSGQRGTIEDELLRSPPGTTSDGDWNPYIKFVAPFIAQDRKYKTSILKRTDSPYWEEVDGVPLVVVEKEYLMANHIVLVFMSDTPKGHKNIPLGQAVVPLRSAFEDQPTPFSALISHKGKECGVVAGHIHCTGFLSVEPELLQLKARWAV